MDVRKLTYFKMLAEVRNFTKAAKQLRISQPSLTHAIQKLEEEVDFKIFERSKREVLLTDSGMEFYEATKELLLQHELLVNKTSAFKSVGTGRILISAIESVKIWMPLVIRSHLDIYPTISYQLNEVLDHEKMIQSLKRHDTHFCISNINSNSELIDSYLLYREELVLVTKEALDTEQTNVNIAFLKDYPLILPSTEYKTHNQIMDAFNLAGVTPLVKFEVERFQTALSFVEQGLGGTILPANCIAFSQSAKNLNVYSLNNPTPKRSVYLHYIKNRHLPDSVKNLIEKCLEFGNNVNKIRNEKLSSKMK